MDFTLEMAAACGKEWDRMHTHPFVAGIGRGDLATDKFIFYLRQDYVYLVEFCRLLALIAARAPDLETMARFKDLLKITMGFEMDLHKRICADFGITVEQLNREKPAPYCLAYTSFLLATAYGGGFADSVAALLPCAWGYYEVGKRLAQLGLPVEKCYREWVETYSSREMADLVEYLRSLMNSLAQGAPNMDKERWKALFARSVSFEVLFWEMGYRKLDKVVEG